MKIAYLDCFSGVSGDMLLSALVDSGWSTAELLSMPERLGLDDVRIETSRVRRGVLAALHVRVHVESAQPERHLRDVRTILENADLPEAVTARAIRVFERLAEAEAEVHGSTPEEVHFHEVGAADALVDIAGVCLGFSSLDVEAIYSSALPLGRGRVRSQHGIIPIPAPATARLLRGVPVEMPDIEAELVTPTGAALLVTLVERWGYCPPFTVGDQGLGSGSRDLPEQPNVLRIFLGETQDSGQVAGATPGHTRPTSTPL
jgi:uncharacterized protein (TIGR00299 family) protein